jgi:hypothetical protein
MDTGRRCISAMSDFTAIYHMEERNRLEVAPSNQIAQIIGFASLQYRSALLILRVTFFTSRRQD